jgi:hypothetical protein
LADLPREAAALALAKTIALLPLGNWKAADSGDIAARLIGCLPRRGTPLVPPALIPPVRSGRGGKAKAKSQPALWLVCAIVAVGWFFVLSHLETSPPLEPAPDASTQQ